MTQVPERLTDGACCSTPPFPSTHNEENGSDSGNNIIIIITMSCNFLHFISELIWVFEYAPQRCIQFVRTCMCMCMCVCVCVCVCAHLSVV